LKNIEDASYVIEIYKGFAIMRCDDSLKVASIKDPKRHTHMHSLHACRKLINDMLVEKIPLKRSTYYLISLSRLTENPEYREKLNRIVNVRKQKGKKQSYHNKNNPVGKGSNYGNNWLGKEKENKWEKVKNIWQKHS